MTEMLQLTVTGMTCGRCEQAVTRVLSNVDGVESVTADHTVSMVGVTFDPERVTPTVIRQQIEGLGYDVAP
jgi:copper chaperone CopZ